MAKTRPCIIDFFETSRRCLPSNDKIGLNITVNMIDAAIDFLCHRGGDRLARKLLLVLPARYNALGENEAGPIMNKKTSKDTID